MEVLFHFCQRNKVHVEGIIMSHYTMKALEERCRRCFVRTTRSGLDSGALEPCSRWNAVANSLQFNPNAFQSVMSILSRSTGHISDAKPHVERLFVAGEIGVFDQLLQDSSEHHDHVL